MHILPFLQRVPEALLFTLNKPRVERLVMRFFYFMIIIDAIILVAVFVKLFYNPWATPFVAAAEKEIAIGQATENFIQGLKDSSMNPINAGRVTRNALSVDGQMILIDGDNIQIYEYLDRDTAMNEATKLRDKYAGSSKPKAWKKNMHIRVDNTLTIFYMGNQSTILRLFD